MRFRILALLAVLLLTMVLVPAISAQGYPVVEYRVQPGDTLAKIAKQYCTTWEEIYQFNAGIIGPDPNNLKPGTLIYAPNKCVSAMQPIAGATPPPASGVYDRGPSMYANGYVVGNVYTVAAGDTWYSIGQRFGLPWETISSYNGGGNLYPGRQLIIPGLSSAPPPQSTYVSITSPTPGNYMAPFFTVTGKGAGLPEGNVVVRALDGSGRTLAQQATTLQGPNVGLGGEGTWSTTLSVNVASNVQGAIEATSPGVQAVAAVSVTFTPPAGGGGSGSMVVYAPGQCTVTGRPGMPMYAYPGGPQSGQFVAGGSFEAKQRTVYNNMDWYMIQPEASMGNPPAWVPVTSLASVGQGCS
jgi:LysM repeat protein